MSIKINPFSDCDKIVNKNDESFVLENYREKKEKSSQIVSKLNKLIQSVILRSLDGLLMIAILPYVCYQWASRNERSLIILKAIVEITLELIMWFIFAGVSILITAAFLMEELYFNQNDNKDVKSSNEISKKKE
ncbi:hypothetical protein V1477_017617 [Vespula maculifrons]|uniref:Uncharacterized protein n=1 Tax=Vespula maculifrons TaxID=7453 RepID=A0ABD2B6J2_VESMC